MTAALPVLLILLLGAVMMHALPAMSRPDILFAVTVPYEFRLDERARAIRREYRLLVWTISAMAGAIAVIVPRWVLPAAGLQMFGAWGAWMWAHRRVKPFAVRGAAGRQYRVASLEPRVQGIPGGPLVAAGPFVILLGSAALLWMNWDRISDRFATHWSAGGVPNGWRTRTFWGVFGQLFMGGIVTTFMLGMAHAIRTRTRQVAATGLAAALEQRFKRGNALYLVVSAYITAVLFSLFSVRPALSGTDRLPTGVWMMMAAIMVLSLGTVAWMYWLGQGGRRQVPSEEVVTPGDGTPDDGWKAGMFYYNPSDPALFVEKRMGFGWTLNMAHKTAWVIMAGVLALAFGPFVVRVWMR
jgi:uncharacterized membrane protein